MRVRKGKRYFDLRYDCVGGRVRCSTHGEFKARVDWLWRRVTRERESENSFAEERRVAAG